MKRLTAIICIAAMLCATIMPVGVATAKTNEKLTIFDGIEVLKYLVGIEDFSSSISDKENVENELDYDCNGVVEIFDFIFVLEKLVGIEEPMPWILKAFGNLTDEKLVQLVESGEIPQNVNELHLTRDYGKLGALTDISPLSELKNLEKLYLSNNLIKDISPLSDLTNLKELYLFDNYISDITSLRKLTNLETLYLTRNPVVDISPLGNLINLKYLSLEDTPVNDFSVLSKLVDLRNGLNLICTKFDDVSILLGLKNLGFVGFTKIEFYDGQPRITKSSITLEQALALKKALPNCSVSYDRYTFCANGYLYDSVAAYRSGYAGYYAPGEFPELIVGQYTLDKYLYNKMPYEDALYWATHIIDEYGDIKSNDESCDCEFCLPLFDEATE